MTMTAPPLYWLTKRRGNAERVLHSRKTCARFPSDEIAGIMNVRAVEGGNRVRICKKCLGGGQDARRYLTSTNDPDVSIVTEELTRLRGQGDAVIVGLLTIAAAFMWTLLGWGWEGAATIVLAVVFYRRFVRVRYTLRPIEQWPGTPTRSRTWSRFKASAANTQRLLERELDMISARNVVIQIDVTERDIRLDGALRADARPKSPAVIVSFELHKRGGEVVSLQYATDTYWKYEENLRAIALTLEALRAIDRYGVSKGGEQYTGWQKLPPGSGSSSGVVPVMDRESAIAVFEANCVGMEGYISSDWKSRYRHAAKQCHPDTGGSRDEWNELQRAAQTLGVA